MNIIYSPFVSHSLDDFIHDFNYLFLLLPRQTLADQLSDLAEFRRRNPRNSAKRLLNLPLRQRTPAVSPLELQ